MKELAKLVSIVYCFAMLVVCVFITPAVLISSLVPNRPSALVFLPIPKTYSSHNSCEAILSLLASVKKSKEIYRMLHVFLILAS